VKVGNILLASNLWFGSKTGAKFNFFFWWTRCKNFWHILISIKPSYINYKHFHTRWCSNWFFLWNNSSFKKVVFWRDYVKSLIKLFFLTFYRFKVLLPTSFPRFLSPNINKSALPGIRNLTKLYSNPFKCLNLFHQLFNYSVFWKNVFVKNAYRKLVHKKLAGIIVKRLLALLPRMYHIVLTKMFN
jgi:hypothetical protein